MRALAFGLLLALASSASMAHKASDSYLTLRIENDGIEGQWDIALKDLEYAVGLDADDDGAITWGELKARHLAVADYAFSRLTLTAGAARCAAGDRRHLVDRHTDGAYAVLRFTARCPLAGKPVGLEYRLLFDLDPSHRGLVRIERGGHVSTAVVSPENPRLEVVPGAQSRAAQFRSYWGEGVRHIRSGVDHLLFLVALLLPSVLRRDGRGWRQVASFRAAAVEAVGVITAFTIAHSVTLSLAVLGWVSVPARLVETVIAASVLLAALDNLYPMFTRRRALLAFALGLVHGLGFANALSALGLPDGALVAALVGFNLGVESGQLALAAVVLPVAFAMRRGWIYRRVVLGGGSVAVALVAGWWLAERALDVRLLPL